MDLQRRDDHYLLRLDGGENRFDATSVAAWNGALDTVEADGAVGLVSTGATDKFYSTGLDLDWLGRPGTDGVAFFVALHALFARMLTLSVPTVAAINGHAFGAGLQIALGHDFRVMRADRGFACMPEIDIGAPLTPGMQAIMEATVPRVTLREMMTTGRRYGGPDAVTANFVHGAHTLGDLEFAAIEIVAPLAGKDQTAMTAIKTDLFRPALAVLDPVRFG